MDAQQNALYLSLALFDGFPYLVTRIAGAIHHLIVLPRDRTEEELVRLARRQFEANRIRSSLVLGRDHALYVSEDSATWGPAPRCDAPTWRRLQPTEAFPATAELLGREVRLAAFVSEHRSLGYFVDRAHGRPATCRDRSQLEGLGPTGVPRGLMQCVICAGWRGEALLGTLDLVVDVYCRCDNHNRCARCLEPLYERRLDACSYFEDSGEVLHVATFQGLDHRCTDLREG